MNVHKITSDEPLYEGISRFSELDRVDTSTRITWKEAICASLASTFVGVTVWYTLEHISKIPLPWYYHVMFGGLVTLVFGVLALTVNHVRCTVCLMLPVSCSTVGRNLLRTFLVSLLLSGPIQNIVDNGIILADSISCSAQLTVQQAEQTATASYNIMKKQMESAKMAIRDINEQSDRIKRYTDEEMIKVLDNEDQGSGHLSPWKMMKLGEIQCHRNSDTPRRKCGVGLSGDGEKCDKIRVTDDRCSEWGSRDAARLNTKYTEQIKSTLARISEEVKEPDLTIASADNVTINHQELVDNISSLMSIILKITGPLQRITEYMATFFLLLILKNAIQCQIAYLTQLSYLNNVVTTKLLQLDGRLEEKHRTFPLPTYMKRFVRDGKRKFLTGEEIHFMFVVTCKRVLFSMVFLIFVFVDIQIYGILEDISDSGYIIYEVYIKLGVLLESKGGKWARPIMDKIPQVNNLHHMSFTQDNNECLPEAVPPDKNKHISIAVFLVVILIANYYEIYAKRSIRRICDCFYPARASERRLFLYRFLKQRRNDCFTLLSEERKAHLPKRTWLTRCWYSLFKPTCVTCSSTKKHFLCYTCQDYGFDVMYCAECWVDAQKKCLYCGTTSYLGTYNPVSRPPNTESARPLFSIDSDEEDGNIAGYENPGTSPNKSPALRPHQPQSNHHTTYTKPPAPQPPLKYKHPMSHNKPPAPRPPQKYKQPMSPLPRKVTISRKTSKTSYSDSEDDETLTYVPNRPVSSKFALIPDTFANDSSDDQDWWPGDSLGPTEYDDGIPGTFNMYENMSWPAPPPPLSDSPPETVSSAGTYSIGATSSRTSFTNDTAISTLTNMASELGDYLSLYYATSRPPEPQSESYSTEWRTLTSVSSLQSHQSEYPSPPTRPPPSPPQDVESVSSIERLSRISRNRSPYVPSPPIQPSARSPVANTSSLLQFSDSEDYADPATARQEYTISGAQISQVSSPKPKRPGNRPSVRRRKN